MTASVFSNHKAIYTAEDSEYGLWTLKGKFAYLPCRIHLRQPVQTVQLLAKFRNKITSKIIAFAIPNENDEVERTSLHTCPDDQVLMPSENNLISSDVDADSDAYISKSGSGFFQRVEHLGIQATLLDKLKALHLHVLASEKWNASRLKLSHRNYMESATNLIHYLALKCLDTEPLSDDLALSSLLNMETVSSSVLDSLTTGIQLLENLQLNFVRKDENVSAGVCMQEKLDQEKTGNFTFTKMRKKVCFNKERLLGSLQSNRMTHIMATVGEEALESETLITDLIKAGTSVIRINCAHGNAGIWSEIIRRAKQSSQMLEAPCRILMDLAGPKLRTSNLKPGPPVVKISPKKNATGNVIFPAQVWLSHKGAGPPPPHVSPDAVLFIDDQNFLMEIKVGDTLSFVDARDKKRMLKVSEVFHTFSGTGFIAECARTAYVSSGTELYVKRKKRRLAVGKEVDVPATESFIRLRVGDLLTISRDDTCDLDSSDNYRYTNCAHRIVCSSGYLFDAVKPGDRIAFDDGKIWGVVKGTSISEIVVSITHAGPRGTKLGSQKSINIADSDIQFEGLTSKDLVDLEFVASHADMVGISFVRDTRDIIVLRQELEKRKLKNLGIVLKIETKSGFEKLPHLLLEAMKSPNPLGVMIARGDLAVECGWERLADIQEEILSVSGAAHVPVIWATQVLESLVKSGIPTRAEITDVASGRRASCIMLNKGRHIVQAVSTLNNILQANSNQTKAKLKSLVLSSHLS